MGETARRREAPAVELHTDGTMVCGELKARPLKLPVRRVWKDGTAGHFTVCDIGPIGTARNWGETDTSDPELTAFDLVCLAALVDALGQ